MHLIAWCWDRFSVRLLGDSLLQRHNISSVQSLQQNLGRHFTGLCTFLRLSVHGMSVCSDFVTFGINELFGVLLSRFPAGAAVSSL